ncbi:MAG: triose-phosphate isomerase [Candidatus Competibacteraceae bacterium]|nr:triose-phosphate isomerase [Candidatus Competibacteraceae bacterium]
MRKQIIAGNWKMHTTIDEAIILASEIMEKIKPDTEQQILFFPPFPYLPEIAKLTTTKSGFDTGAQNCSSEHSGAYTGEVAAFMIRSTGAGWVIIGHSERRQLMNETHDVLKKKTEQALSENLRVVFCCGESLAQRNENLQNRMIANQLYDSIFHLSPDMMKNIVIAYEPVWAIGTGQTASPQQAQDMHQFIRNEIAKQFNEYLASEIPIIYGGSVKSSNASSLFSQPDIDGALVGGASLFVDEFVSIIHAR